MMYKITSIITNNQTSDVVTTSKYAIGLDNVEKIQNAISDIILEKMNEESDTYTPGVKWGVKFEVEEVGNSTALDDLTLADLKMFISMISRGEI